MARFELIENILKNKVRESVGIRQRQPSLNANKDYSTRRRKEPKTRTKESETKRSRFPSN